MVDFKKITLRQIKKIFGPKATKKSIYDDYLEFKNHNKQMFREDSVNEVLENLKRFIDNKQTMEKIFDSSNNGKFFIVVTPEGREIKYAINNEFKNKTFRHISNGYIPETKTDEKAGSDEVTAKLIVYDEIGSYHIEEPKAQNNNKKKFGGFFKYYHNLDFDFSRYGILKSFDADYFSDNCLVHSFRNGGMSEQKINKLKLEMRDSNISMCHFNRIATDLDIKIILRYPRNDCSKLRISSYGSNEDEIYELCLIDEHYFIYERSNITSYAINNYEDVKDEDNFNEIFRICHSKYYERSQDRFIKSSDVVLALLRNKEQLLTPIELDDDIMSTPYYNKVSQNIDFLYYNSTDCQKFKKMRSDPKPSFIVFFDFETVTIGDVHTPYMVHYCSEFENETHEIIGYRDDLGKLFLDEVLARYQTINQIVLIAHNMRYDLSFISRFLYQLKTVEAGNKIISVSGRYNATNLKIKDSYSMISMKLDSFNKTFDLGETKKQIINYDLYNQYVPNIDFENEMFSFPIEHIANNYYASNKAQFIKNIYDWDLVDEDYFNLIGYASYYCSQDVLTLKAGYLKFAEWLDDLYDVDIRQKCSISGVADQILKEYGCYDNCYSFSGIVRRFISESVVGGRTMSANNEMNMVGNTNEIDFNSTDEVGELSKLTERISDFDGVSLYPSSMVRIPGFIQGIPHIFDNKMTYDELKRKHYYFVEIEVTRIGIQRDFALLSKKDNEGIRIFSNDMVGQKFVVDKFTLEDLIEFQQIEFNIIRGYLFINGFNKKINTLIQSMFEERRKKKEEGNPVEVVYKLLMNAAYGKTILKETEVCKKYFDTEEDLNKFMVRNYNNIVEARQLYKDHKFIVKYREEICTHSNFCHIGSMILSMSKRIMNEVMCTAEDNNIKIFYQDTDSMHMFEKDIQLLALVYQQKYNRVLIGKDLGQFHSDFAMENKNLKNVNSKLCIILGKKCYLDIIKSDQSDDVEMHARLKGIPNKSLLHTARKLYGHQLDVFNVLHLYNDLFNHDEVEFDLTCDGLAIKMETFDLTVRTKTDFKRTIKF
ncbi:MAG: DNA polymerase [Pedobacter agri]